MTITALPEATIRLLGSAQALTTPPSLVKELIDNALDAKASTIDILISTNTIDKIEVRDNGHGIPEEDFEALGKHGHTSKLRSFEELRSIAALSLGFRGEALASACQLGEVSVTTRTEGEAAATMLKLKPLGGVASQGRTSNPIGTTVNVKNFLSKFPVRKQNALKEAAKMLTRLRGLLQAYSLARPRVRFSLKIIKSSKGSWSYAPHPADGIRGAVSVVIGRDCAGQCLEKSLVFPEHGYVEGIDQDQSTEDIGPDNVSSENGGHEFVIDMFLPKPDSDVSKIGHGQFISIDSRPVSNDKGTMRKIVTLFRSYLKESISESSEKLKNPFLFMNIRCPVASYDANVEPAKNDVLFCNEALVLESIEKAFKVFYGKPKNSSTAATSQSTIKIDDIEISNTQTPEPQLADDADPPSMSAASSEPAFENLLTQPGALTRAEHIREIDSLGVMEEDEESEELPSDHWRIDMSEDFSEEIRGLYKGDLTGRVPDGSQASDLAVQSVRSNSLNPWLIAKLNAPVQRSQEIPTIGSDSTGLRGQSRNLLPTPQQSSDPVSVDLNSPQSLSHQARPRQTFRVRDITSLNVQNIDRMSRHPLRPPSDELEDDLLLGDDSTTFNRRNDFISARQLPHDPSMLQEPARPLPFKKLKETKRSNNPFIPPTRIGEAGPSQDGLRQIKLGVAKRDPTLSNPQELSPDSDLAWAMDFEHRKEDATRQRREEMKAARLEARALQEEEDIRLYGPKVPANNSPHKNRYNAAIATLEAGPEIFPNIVPVLPKQPFKKSLPDGDSRAYLMKRQRSVSLGLGPRKLSRAKSMRLPLERIPEKDQLHSLLLSLSSEMSRLRVMANCLKETDLYVQRGVLGSGLELDGSEKEDVNRKIQVLVEKWEEKKLQCLVKC